MTFVPGKEGMFLEIFNSSKDRIRACHGCHELQLLNDIAEPNIFFTYSLWDTEEDLLNYRQSQLFEETWKKVKPIFAKDAEAWSLEKKE